MRILFLTPWYPDERNPNHGIFVRDQVRVIARGHDVRVVSAKVDYTRFGPSSLKRMDQRWEGVDESRILIRQSFPVVNQLNFFVRIVYETVKIARQFKPEVIHGNIGYPGAFWSWGVSQLLRIPYLVTEHTRITNNFRSRIHRSLTLFGLNRAGAVVAVSAWQADEIKRLSSAQPVVIPNVIHFEKHPAISPWIDSPETHIGFLGNMNTPVKGLDLLLNALSGIQEHCVLHIGGAGALMEEYRATASRLGIADRCVFYGAIPHEEVHAFMSRLHFFVSASRFETFGIAMVEALACGLPLVATDNGGSREFLNENNGIMVPVEDTIALRDAVIRMIGTYRKYDRQKMRKEVVTKFSNEAFLHKVESVYQSLTNGTREDDE